MHPDAERWNARYRARRGAQAFEPDPDLVTLAPRWGSRGRALDLACGSGANALWLARRGFDVVAVDVALEGLRLGAAQARRRAQPAVAWVVADACRLPLGAVRFDLLVVVRFLDRRLFPMLAQALQPGGYLFYKTFNRAHLRERPGFAPAFLLERGELPASFPELEVLLARDDAGNGDSSVLLARKSP